MELTDEAMRIPQAGDHVWHVSCFKLTAGELIRKGLEGFRSWGFEVIESVLEEPYIERRPNGTTTILWIAKVVKREVGEETRENSCILCKAQDFGTIVFWTQQEAARQAEKQMKRAELALSGSKFEQRPMYRNWEHWSGNGNARKRSTLYRTGMRKAELPEELYIQWRDGELSAADGARALGVTEVTFTKYARERLAERKETRTPLGGRKPLPEKFYDIYVEWEKGNITMAEAARKCGMKWQTFRLHALRLKKRREAEEIYG